jgi:hypothetical protein
MSVRDAVSRFVHKGDFIASGGFGHVRIFVAIGGYGHGRDVSSSIPNCSTAVSSLHHGIFL